MSAHNEVAITDKASEPTNGYSHPPRHRERRYGRNDAGVGNDREACRHTVAKCDTGSACESLTQNGYVAPTRAREWR